MVLDILDDGFGGVYTLEERMSDATQKHPNLLRAAVAHGEPGSSL